MKKKKFYSHYEKITFLIKNLKVFECIWGTLAWNGVDKFSREKNFFILFFRERERRKKNEINCI